MPNTKRLLTLQDVTETINQTKRERPARRREISSDRAVAKPEKIRAELNIEKWPAIWNPTHSKIHSKDNVQSRTLEREISGPDGTKTVSQVTINPIAHLGDLTTDDQRTLYALIKHWEDRGKPPHETPFSIRHVAKLLHKKGWGTNVIDAITGSLERLRGTLLVWTRSYRSRDQRVEDMERVYVNILSKLKVIRRKVDGHVTTEAGYFQFDDHLLKNLLDNYTKPFLFEVFMSIKGEITLKLYSYLDLIMADKTRFERCTKELFEDLGLNGTSYRNPSKRKQNLESAFEELQGLMLTTGVLKSATIEKTKDGKDYKAVFQKVSRTAFAQEEISATTFASVEPVVINDYSKTQDPTMAQAKEVVRYFHRIIHGTEQHEPQSRESDQALTLFTRYGFEKTKHIIDYAAGKATETNFKIQHFGAVLSYTSRAIADFDRRRAPERSRKEPAPASIVRPAPEKRWARGEARLAALTPEQYRARFDKIRADLFAEVPFLAQQRSGSDLQEKMVRSRLVQAMEREPMDVLLLDALKLPEPLRKIFPFPGAQKAGTSL